MAYGSPYWLPIRSDEETPTSSKNRADVGRLRHAADNRRLLVERTKSHPPSSLNRGAPTLPAHRAHAVVARFARGVAQTGIFRLPRFALHRRPRATTLGIPIAVRLAGTGDLICDPNHHLLKIAG